ncbi:glycosyltransferase family 4 protein [uncultured Hymenobacter sp.]|uniref:glycosyltransferase family 4 protein n=1 Tax=uncultured Hymenobacter sp. TaxID=170016 RepID=UPI0035C98F51
MRIAHVSFEYPPDTADGGIATYVHQVSHMLRDRGHDVEVFCASPTRTVSEVFEGVMVHRVQAGREDFRTKVVAVFGEQHAQQAFDIMESPEYGADGYDIKRAYPALPLVVKLHTPSFLLYDLTTYYQVTPLLVKLRYLVGGLLRGQLRQPHWQWKRKSQDMEYQLCRLADQIHTPSVSLGQLVARRWDIAKSKIHHVPYPFIPNQEFLAVPLGTDCQTFAYIGRLEVRKGIVALVEAARLIFQAVPAARFIIIGRSQQSHIPGLDMRAYIEQQLREYRDRLDFREVRPQEIPAVLAQTDVCVYPSLWENFPNVCLEAMSAGRAIVGSEQGGMKDMLTSPQAGLLVPPTNAAAIAEAVITLLNNPPLRRKLGETARQKVLTSYTSDVIGPLVEAKYAEAIRSRRG